MGLIMRRNLMAAKSGYTANDYVQDGLVAMWDGIENAGWGVHDQNATVWKDLIGGLEIDMSGFSVAGNGFVMDSLESVSSASTIAPLGNSCTAEIVCSFSGTTNANSFFALFADIQPSNRTYDAGPSIRFFKRSGYGWNNPTGYRLLNFQKEKAHSFSYVFGGDKISSNVCADGSMIEGFELFTAPNVNSNTDVMFGFVNADSKPNSIYTFFSLRIYNKAISEEEYAANYAIDKARFNLPDAT